MDEPLSNLDAKLRVQMRAEISKLHDRLGATIIYVTHDQTEAMTLGSRIVVMKEGVMQQVDTPSKLYAEPCNLFVAGFIGSPQMNFIDATVGEADGKITLTFGSNVITVPETKAEVLKPYVGKVVVAGIRPEDVIEEHEHADDKNLSETIDAVVTVYELLGAEAMIYGDVDGGTISAHLSATNPVRTGSRVRVAFDMDKLHVFDKETELAIVH